MAEEKKPEAAVLALYETCSNTDNLARLAQVAGLRPEIDFEEADLRELSVAGEDLTAFSFRGADLRMSDLRRARLSRSALEGALLTGAMLNDIVWVGPAESDRPMFGAKEVWSELTREVLNHWISRVAPVDGKYRMSPDTTRGFRRELPFYDRVELLAFVDEKWIEKFLVIYYLHDQGALFRLNGTSPPVHEVNAKAPIQLTDANVIDYLRFFCMMVRGEEGPFYILESADDPHVPKDIDAETRKLIEGNARPAFLEGVNDEGHFLLDALVFYSNSLFVANFAVQPTGMVEMLNDEPIAADLKVRVKAPIV